LDVGIKNKYNLSPRVSDRPKCQAYVVSIFEAASSSFTKSKAVETGIDKFYPVVFLFCVSVLCFFVCVFFGFFGFSAAWNKMWEKGCLPFSQEIRKFRLKFRWSSNFAENPFGNC